MKILTLRDITKLVSIVALTIYIYYIYKCCIFICVSSQYLAPKPGENTKGLDRTDQNV